MNATDQSLARDATVLILGVGETGAAAARWCARQGAVLRVADTRTQPPGIDALRDALGEAEVSFVLGPDAFAESVLDGVSQIVLSPGLAPGASPTREVLEEARARNIEVVGEIELFARALIELAASRDYQPRVLAITGTNGKTTVTALTRQMVEASGLSATAAGNISPAALAALMDALDADALPQVWVIELSSFQLETTFSLAPDAAVVLNVTQDHLDWHGTQAAYAAAKARIYNNARVMVVNRDDAAVMTMVDGVAGMSMRSFGRDVPLLVGDMGMESGSGVTWLAAAEPTLLDDENAQPKRKKNAPPPERFPGRLSRLMPADALRLRGLHNAANVLAALALCRSLDLGWGPLLRAARDYAGEPHRATFVRTIAGVDFINDSKGTNVGATVAALEGLGQRVVLIAGGLGKGQDFKPLSQAVARHARAVVLIGQDAEVIAQALADSNVQQVQARNLDDAVAQAFSLAEPGDAVLLSPACASMDMFRNYNHRGESFVDAVQGLALDHGEVV